MGDGALRIGFVGAGGIVRQRHVPGLRDVPGVEFAGVVNSSRESSERAAREFGIRRVYDSWRELVGSDEVDVVWIGTHPNLHREVTLAALEAGKHVFCQARMAMDYRDARAMWEAAERSDRTTMLCPPPHYMRGDRVVRRLIGERFVGEPRNVVIQSYSAAYADPSKPLHWRQQGAVSGFNTLDLGMMIEVLHRWLGYARQVVALERTFAAERPAGDGGSGAVERPDTVSAAIELESGALVTLTVSGVAQHARDANRFELYGSEGTIRYLAGADKILAGKVGDGELAEVPITPDEERRWSVEADFVEGVRAGRRSVEPSVWDGLKYMELTEAIFRSVESGRAVDLPFEDLKRSG